MFQFWLHIICLHATYFLVYLRPTYFLILKGDVPFISSSLFTFIIYVNYLFKVNKNIK